MTRPVYPASLPGVLPYQLTPDDQLARSEDPQIPLVQRRITAQPSATVKVGWRFLRDEFSVFRSWWRDTLLRGHRWFEMSLYSAAGYVPHVVRFAEPFQSTEVGYGYREVTAVLEIRERIFNYVLEPEILLSWPELHSGDAGYPAVGTFYPLTHVIGPYANNVRLTVSDAGVSGPDDYFHVDGVRIRPEQLPATTVPPGFVIKERVIAGRTVDIQVMNTMDSFSSGTLYLRIDPIL